MTTYFTADQHFGHKNIIKLVDRRFDDVTSMDEYMVHMWNERVSKNDTVYHLGDMFFSNDRKYIRSILSRLNGSIKLVPGNHDKIILKPGYVGNLEILSNTATYRENKKSVILSHYPLLEWNGYFRGYFHFFGHVHGNIGKRRVLGSIDVGVDSMGYMPTSFEDLTSMLSGEVDR